MVEFENLEVNSESFSKLPYRLRHNEVLSDYCLEYSKDFSIDGRRDESLLLRAERVKNCSRVWDVDYFRLQGVKHLVKTNRCRDRFCPNCQMALSLKRVHQYSPLLTALSKNDSVYHCIFTVKNCSGVFLRSTIKQMYKSYSYFCRYLDGRARIKGFTFSFMGYRASVKSLEVTYNSKSNTYHPHLHCLMVFGKDLNLEQKYKTVFSYSYNHDTGRRYSSEELLFQKIWFLLNNNQKVTKENIEAIEVGYSVQFNKADPKDYKEVFKYPFKEDLKDGQFISYEQFKLYDSALRGIRYVQGYGDVLNFDFDDDSMSDEELDRACNDLISECLDIEDPCRVYECYDTIVDNMATGNYHYVTSGSVKKFILSAEDN